MLTVTTGESTEWHLVTELKLPTINLFDSLYQSYSVAVKQTTPSAATTTTILLLMMNIVITIIMVMMMK